MSLKTNVEVEFEVNKHTNINGAGTSLVEAAGISPVEIEDVQEKTPGGWERIKTFAGLSEGVPINEYGLPEFLYRADLVPSNLSELSDDERGGSRGAEGAGKAPSRI